MDYYEVKSQPISKVMVWEAYQRVRTNKGASGIDGMSWEDLDKDVSKQLYKLWNRLTSGSYFPESVKSVEIPKKNGGKRMLGIPTILDRIAQEVVRKQLEKAVEPIFHDSSYGYRPNKSCHDAVEQSCKNCFNHDFVVDVDIENFFDTIDHKLLIKAIHHYCKDKWVLLYVTRWLKAGIVQQDKVEISRLTGTPQGGVISPLLANLFLHVSFDAWMLKEHPEKPFERYADDIVVHCKTEKQARYMLKKIETRFKKCQLKLHPTKSKIVNLRGKSEVKYAKSYDFLGFSIRPNQAKMKGKYYEVPSIFVSQKSRKAILEKFRRLNLHKYRGKIETLAKDMRPIIRGVINYYHKFSDNHMRYVWNQLNVRLLKWVKWEKGLYKYRSLSWLRLQYKKHPDLFPHWRLVHP